MQAENDDDLDEGQRSSEVKCYCLGLVSIGVEFGLAL